MKTSQRKQTPRRRVDADKVDRLAADLAHDMLNWICTRYENAEDDEKLGIILQYGSVIFELQKVINKANRARRRRSMQIEQKGA